MSTNIFRISKNFKVKFTLYKSPRGPPVIKFEKSNISAITGKKINVIAFLDQFLPQFKTRHRKQSKNVETCWQTRFIGWIFQRPEIRLHKFKEMYSQRNELFSEYATMIGINYCNFPTVMNQFPFVSLIEG